MNGGCCIGKALSIGEIRRREKMFELFVAWLNGFPVIVQIVILIGISVLYMAFAVFCASLTDLVNPYLKD